LYEQGVEEGAEQGAEQGAEHGAEKLLKYPILSATIKLGLICKQYSFYFKPIIFYFPTQF
jgi:hypothetical protein